ncbi:MAG: S-layer homology domain-containing protein [Clostridiales bacterium]|nr:S-layer homology domain-containing protein [Clostridiales bacterium]
MKWAVGVGLIGGMGDGTVCPQGNATRAQVSAIIERHIKTQ